MDTSKPTIFYCQGLWTQAETAQLRRALATLQPQANKPLIIDGSKVEALDSVGALLLVHCARHWESLGGTVQWKGFSEAHEEVFSLIREYAPDQPIVPTQPSLPWMQILGQKTVNLGLQLWAFFSFIGRVCYEILGWCRSPTKIRFKSICANIQATGTRATFIIALLSFLIGIVLSYQIGVQLRNYGANIFVVDFLGLAILREFGPMITAIIIAGRTGSSYAAQIGTMKLTEEVAALQTMGLSPIEVLVLPRLMALWIALPLLVILSEVMALFGGMIMAKTMLGLSFFDFMDRFSSAIDLKTFLIGLIKVPVFASLIAAIGAFQGFQVKDSAASVGERTTISVVQGIFMIIVVDAGFSILFDQLGL
ncbi:MAG: mlaE 1 [Gammaproteobacteria bacterium]|jgi:phospholipid/cholesterol/gamma-HCH transport system permease protein|nr:mlaE 1 [Gammaproteobacteria bacterium]